MSQSESFIKRLEALQEGERACLRRLAGMPLDTTVAGFDLFTGLWWPLRQKSPVAPRRETSWLIAKLYGAFPIPNTPFEDGKNRQLLARVLRRCEPHDDHNGPRFRSRFDALLCSPLPSIEPHLRWALGEISKAIAGRVQWAKGVTSINWAQLLDDLSIWDRGEDHRRGRDIRDIWAEDYLNDTYQLQGASNAD